MNRVLFPIVCYFIFKIGNRKNLLFVIWLSNLTSFDGELFRVVGWEEECLSCKSQFPNSISQLSTEQEVSGYISDTNDLLDFDSSPMMLLKKKEENHGFGKWTYTLFLDLIADELVFSEY